MQLSSNESDSVAVGGQLPLLNSQHSSLDVENPSVHCIALSSQQTSLEEETPSAQPKP